MPKDIEILEHNGTIRVKALTDLARQKMGTDMGGPWQMASEVFWVRIDPSRLSVILGKLKAMGLQTEDDQDAEPWAF